MQNRMFSRIVIFVIAICALATPAISQTNRNLKVVLNLQRLICHDTTERGEDEVYIVVGVKHYNGPTGQFRRPADMPHNNAGYWSMNDGERSNSQFGPYGIDELDVASGHKATLFVTIMEEDGGRPDDWTSRASNILAKVPEKRAQAISEALKDISNIFKLFDIKDTDDVIGSFAVNVENDNGKLKYEYIRGLGVVSQDGGTIVGNNNSVVDKAMRYEFEHDGSKYRGEFYLSLR